MSQLQERGYYENRYDRLVVDTCRMYESISSKEKIFKANPSMDLKQIKRASDYISWLMLYFKK
jgi:hypothetical protein